jgi:putative glutamine amidotransferase
MTNSQTPTPNSQGVPKPRIGITRCSRMDDYIASVERAGGDPIVLETHDDPSDALRRIDGLLLTGGLDVDPSLYRHAAHPTTEVDRARDRFEVPLSRRALEGDVPLLAICRGVQVLNVAAGGTLVQDIPSELDTDLNHSVNQPKDKPSHDVRVKPGTRLASILPGDAELSTCPVNSRHHQAVGTVAPSFVVAATSPDGVIEAIERPAATFCVGVQWHPENFWKTGEFMPLFEALITAAQQSRRPVSG